MVRQRVLDTAGLPYVIRHYQRAPRIPIAGALPHPRQRVLEDRELVRFIDHVVHQRRHDLGFDLALEHSGGLGDGAAKIVGLESGGQVLGAVDRFRQFQKARALVQRIGAHRECNVNTPSRIGSFQPRLKNRVDEGFCLVFLVDARLGVAKDLLELIDQ